MARMRLLLFERTTMDDGYGGVSGFLPGRASLMLDVVVVAMFFVLLALAYSIYAVKVLKRYQRHKRVQLTLASTLLIVLMLFEIDVHFIDKWMVRADPSPYFDSASRSGLVVYSLGVHLCFATTTFMLWLVIILRALARFPNPPHPSDHSRFHKRWGTVAALDMVMTTLTGWLFYWLAFVA
jgi:putative membrane protein